MAYPIKLNNQYKSEKEAGTTTAKSFPEWHKEFLARTPLLDELLTVFEPIVLEEVNPELHQDTSEEIEQAIAATPLTQEQVAAIIAALIEQPTETEVVTPISKAAHARLIYQEEEQLAVLAKTTLIRNKVIKRFMAELPLSAPGSATYFQNIKKSKGLVNHKS